MKIDVTAGSYEAASVVFGQHIHDGVHAAYLTLGRALRSTAAMAGSDPMGVTWATEYDQAAAATMKTIRDLCAGSLKLAAMLERSGFNHGVAEWASDPSKAVLAPADTTRYAPQPDFSCVTSPPSAAGGSSSPPHGWGIVQQAVGHVWPDGHPDRLRAAYQAWSTAADAIDAQSGLVSSAQIAILEQRSPEVDDAWAVCDSMGQHINDTAAACRALSGACWDLAEHIEQAHSAIEQALSDFLIWTAAIEGAGGLLSFVTAGLSEATAQLAESKRIGSLVTTVSAAITALGSATETVTAAVRAIKTTITGIAERLQFIVNARLATLTIAMSAREPELAGEAGAYVRLTKTGEADARITKALASADREIPGVGKVTAHGAQRVAGHGATRGGSLTPAQIVRARAQGKVYRQRNGAIAKVYENENGRFEVVIDGAHKMISSLGPISAKKLAGLARNYGWQA